MRLGWPQLLPRLGFEDSSFQSLWLETSDHRLRGSTGNHRDYMPRFIELGPSVASLAKGSQLGNMNDVSCVKLEFSY